MQLGQHCLSQRLHLVKITFGDLQTIQVLVKLCAEHRGVQAFATSKTHMGVHAVLRPRCTPSAAQHIGMLP